MMPSNSIIPSKPMSQETNPTSGSNKKVGSSSTTSVKLNPPEQALKCPRCDSSNTKFCYYNNYNLSQPRHFCKTCRRYWTKGGALRNVPIGGGCRKNKRISTKSSSRNDSSSIDYSISPSSSENINGLKFFPGISSPSMEFQLGGGGGGGGGLPFSSRLISTNGVYNQFLPYGDQNPNSSSTSTTINNPSFMGFNFHGGSSSISDLTTTTTTTSNCTNGGGIQEMGSSSINVHSNLASSIESLSCINQDLHWKLQQQRLGMGMLFGDNNHKEIISNDDLHEIQTEKTQPILFQNLDISKPDGLALGNNNNQRKSGSASHGGGNPRTEWFFENTPTTNYIPNSNINSNPTTNNNNINRQGNENPSGWDGFQGWTTSGLNHQHYNGLQE